MDNRGNTNSSTNTTAKNDSVIKGVYCHNITQNLSFLPWLLWITHVCDRLRTAKLISFWCPLNKIYCRNSIDDFFLTAKNSQQIIVILESFTMAACTWISILSSISLHDFVILNHSEAEDQNVPQCSIHTKHWHTWLIVPIPNIVISHVWFLWM